MRKPIAKIRIAPGNPGWYDSLTNTHLTITRPEAIIYEGFNTTNIKKGVSYKLIHVIDGSLDSNVASIENKKTKVKSVREVDFKEPKKTNKKVTTKKQSKKENKTVETKIVEEVKKEDTKNNIINEEVIVSLEQPTVDNKEVFIEIKDDKTEEVVEEIIEETKEEILESEEALENETDDTTKKSVKKNKKSSKSKKEEETE